MNINIYNNLNNNIYINIYNNIIIKLTVTICLLVVLHISAYGQKPPRPIIVVKDFDLSFGAFYQGPAGGTVSVDKAGTRTSPDIVLLGGYPISPAIFSVTGREGTPVTLTLSSDVSLTGSSGGSMMLQLDPDTDPVNPFVLTGGDPATVDLHIGGTLTVGPPGSSPAGSYSGTFIIIFNQN